MIELFKFRSAAVLLSSSLSPSSTNNQQPLTTSDNVLQQIASPNLIPIIVPSDTIQSNSTLITVFSISKSTGDETCDINIVEQPPSIKTKIQMASHYLNFPKSCGIAAFSVSLWMLGVILIRYFGPYWFRTNFGRNVSMASTVPFSYISIYIAEIMFSLHSHEILAAVALGTGIASILDGMAHAWYPSAYENPSLQKTNPHAACCISRYGSGWLLFFVGIILTMAVFI
ncbi:unnamed protein product [Rotaria socialis]|uniref:Uncharacterized protein n=1 Tax=Rotaria socialis TaxID=392032 RepID=A0A818Z259_9BILA|nr:unnamed protein product [Rotaria socialis]